MKTAIVGGRVLDPSQDLDGVRDVFLADGRILALGEAPPGFVPDLRIQAAGALVTAGFIDLQAHLREPGLTHKGRIATETAAAVAAGITSLCCAPLTQPPLDSPAVAQLVQDKAAAAGQARVLPLGALTRGLEGRELSNLVALREAGCVAFSNLGQWPENSRTLMRCCEYAATRDLLLFVRAEEASLARGCAHDGITAMRLGLEAVPETAETLEVARFLLLAEETGVRLHFGQITAARSLEMIAAARERGLPVTLDVAAHHLLLCDEDVDGFDSRYHLRPPLRSRSDRDGLRQALAHSVDALCSDHQPHEAAAKAAPFAETEPGISALETLLPLGLRLVEEGVLPLMRLVHLLTSGPARVLGVEQGRLQPGAPADLVVWNAHWRAELTEDRLRSAGHNSPFIGQVLPGRVLATLVDGRIVHEQTGIVEKP